MAAPAQAVGLTPYDWNGPEARPPAYACLQGLEVYVYDVLVYGVTYLGIYIIYAA